MLRKFFLIGMSCLFFGRPNAAFGADGVYLQPATAAYYFNLLGLLEGTTMASARRKYMELASQETRRLQNGDPEAQLRLVELAEAWAFVNHYENWKSSRYYIDQALTKGLVDMDLLREFFFKPHPHLRLVHDASQSQPEPATHSVAPGLLAAYSQHPEDLVQFLTTVEPEPSEEQLNADFIKMVEGINKHFAELSQSNESNLGPKDAKPLDLSGLKAPAMALNVQMEISRQIRLLGDALKDPASGIASNSRFDQTLAQILQFGDKDRYLEAANLVHKMGLTSEPIQRALVARLESHNDPTWSTKRWGPGAGLIQTYWNVKRSEVAAGTLAEMGKNIIPAARSVLLAQAEDSKFSNAEKLARLRAAMSGRTLQNPLGPDDEVRLVRLASGNDRDLVYESTLWLWALKSQPDWVRERLASLGQDPQRTPAQAALLVTLRLLDGATDADWNAVKMDPTLLVRGLDSLLKRGLFEVVTPAVRSSFNDLSRSNATNRELRRNLDRINSSLTSQRWISHSDAALDDLNFKSVDWDLVRDQMKDMIAGRPSVCNDSLKKKHPPLDLGFF